MNTVCLEAKIDELEASIAEMKEMLDQRECLVKALLCAYQIIFLLLFCSCRDKVSVNQDREFQVVTVDREAGWRSVTTQTPVGMEGNPAVATN